ncbi:MAG: hypothetical protein WC718_07210 [Phycisphaerales bacterium]|jgi:hypothetical protein
MSKTQAATPKHATFADFAVVHYEFEIEDPAGEVLVAEMRAITQAELLRIRRSLGNPPTPPVKEIKKDEDGYHEIYNYADPGHQQAMADRNALLETRVLLASWTTDIPGDTEDERIAALDTLPAWARVGLVRAVGMLIGIAEDAVRLRPFQRAGTTTVPLVESDAVE